MQSQKKEIKLATELVAVREKMLKSREREREGGKRERREKGERERKEREERERREREREGGKRERGERKERERGRKEREWIQKQDKDTFTQKSNHGNELNNNEQTNIFFIMLRA